jgi:hypothetical protein
MCACSLDHITPSGLATVEDRLVQITTFTLVSIKQNADMLEGTGSKPCPFLSALSIRLSGLLKNGRRGHSTQRTEHRARLACAMFVSLVGRALVQGRWWSQAGSNRRPPACKAGALPAELWPLGVWWVWEDSNFRPHPYQGCALTN